jgi:hypothetical protein
MSVEAAGFNLGHENRAGAPPDHATRDEARRDPFTYVEGFYKR